MRIIKIKIKNFGPFYKEHEIEFPREGYGIHILRGNNGQGKTSFQRAMLWGLYGRVFDRTNKQISLTSLVNMTACKESDFGFSVSIHFIHEDKIWCITRKTEAGANKENLFERNMQLFITKDGEPQNNPQLVIERIMPHDVSRFFFFDGEMLRDYEELLDQDSANMKLLRDSIERILGIPYLRLARNDLNQIVSETDVEKARLMKRLGVKEFDQLANDFQIVVDNIRRLETSIKDLDSQIASNELQTADKKRKQADLRSVRDYAVERNSIDQKIKLLDNKKETQEIKLKDLNSKLYKTVLFPMARNVMTQLEMKHKVAMEKYDKKQQLLARVGSLNQCVVVGKCDLCETVIQGNKREELLNELKMISEEINSLTQIPEPNLEFSEYRGILETLLKNPLNAQSYKAISKEISDINYEKATLEGRRNELSQKLIDVDEEEPFRIETEIRVLSEEHGRLLQEKTQITGDLAFAMDRKSDLEQRMARIDKDELKALETRIQNCKIISEVFDKSIATYRESRRKEVESQATGIFRRIRSKEEFERLIINQNFGLCIMTKHGTVLDKAEWRSAGEEQVVALALIGALNKCSKTLAPVFMDTPFGRFDNTHVGKVLNYLPSISEQIVLLVTDREFSKSDEMLLQGKIVSDFTIRHKGEREGSFISETLGGGIN